jgi:large subunit ribosomal protein L10
LATPEKERKIEKMRELIVGHPAAVLVEYRGLKVGEMVRLRREIRNAGGQLHVVKNTLLRRALAGSEAEDLSEHVAGPIGVVFCADDVGAPAKAAYEFATNAPALQVKAAWADGRIYVGDQVSVRSKLPSRQVLLGQLAGVLNAPIAGLATSLNGIITSLARALDQVAETRGSQAA